MPRVLPHTRGAFVPRNAPRQPRAMVDDLAFIREEVNDQRQYQVELVTWAKGEVTVTYRKVEPARPAGFRKR